MLPHQRIWRLRLGVYNSAAEECFSDGSAGVGYDIEEDLTGKFPDNWKEFNATYIPKWLEANPEKTRVGAGLSCGALWTFGHGMNKGDLLLSPDADGQFHIGTVVGDYTYDPDNSSFPHRRNVDWSNSIIAKEVLSPDLWRSIRGPLALVEITDHDEEINTFLGETKLQKITVSDPDVEDPSIFALEKHLEDFLVANWKQTSLAENYDLVQEDGEVVARQYPTDTGPIDILAISKDASELLVIELKRGRASDVAVGQIQRYMGYIVSEIATKEQTVRGTIIALKDDPKLQRALTVAPNIDFYRYKVNFVLEKYDIKP